MNGNVIPFPQRLPRLPYRGTVCVMGSEETGFQVGHESSSGDSWGNFSGPFADGRDAIAVAYALNRDVYLGGCDVEICDEALADQRANTHGKEGDHER